MGTVTHELVCHVSGASLRRLVGLTLLRLVVFSVCCVSLVFLISLMYLYIGAKVAGEGEVIRTVALFFVISAFTLALSLYIVERILYLVFVFGVYRWTKRNPGKLTLSYTGRDELVVTLPKFWGERWRWYTIVKGKETMRVAVGMKNKGEYWDLFTRSREECLHVVGDRLKLLPVDETVGWYRWLGVDVGYRFWEVSPADFVPFFEIDRFFIFELGDTEEWGFR